MQVYRDYCIVPDNFYPAKSFQKYVSRGIVRKYHRGETIILPGEVIQSVVYVLVGKVGVYFLEEEKQKLMYYARRYCMIDRLFSFDVSLVHVVAEENSEVCFFSEEKLLDIFKQDDEAHREFLKNFACKCGFFMHTSKEMDLFSPNTRVLRLIGELCSTKGKRENDVYEIDIKLTQKTISEITGVHSVTVCKILGWLKKEKILKKTSNKIMVYDLPRLQELIGENIKY